MACDKVAAPRLGLVAAEDLDVQVLEDQHREMLAKAGATAGVGAAQKKKRKKEALHKPGPLMLRTGTMEITSDALFAEVEARKEKVDKETADKQDKKDKKAKELKELPRIIADVQLEVAEHFDSGKKKGVATKLRKLLVHMKKRENPKWKTADNAMYVKLDDALKLTADDFVTTATKIYEESLPDIDE